MPIKHNPQSLFNICCNKVINTILFPKANTEEIKSIATNTSKLSQLDQQLTIQKCRLQCSPNCDEYTVVKTSELEQPLNREGIPISLQETHCPVSTVYCKDFIGPSCFSLQYSENNPYTYTCVNNYENREERKNDDDKNPNDVRLTIYAQKEKLPIRFLRCRNNFFDSIDYDDENIENEIGLHMLIDNNYKYAKVNFNITDTSDSRLNILDIFYKILFELKHNSIKAVKEEIKRAQTVCYLIPDCTLIDHKHEHECCNTCCLETCCAQKDSAFSILYNANQKRFKVMSLLFYRAELYYIGSYHSTLQDITFSLLHEQLIFNYYKSKNNMENYCAYVTNVVLNSFVDEKKMAFVFKFLQLEHAKLLKNLYKYCEENELPIYLKNAILDQTQLPQLLFQALCLTHCPLISSFSKSIKKTACKVAKVFEKDISYLFPNLLLQLQILETLLPDYKIFNIGGEKEVLELRIGDKVYSQEECLLNLYKELKINDYVAKQMALNIKKASTRTRARSMISSQVQ